MHIAVCMSTFPVLTTTFLVNRINGLLERGHQITIIADTGSKEGGSQAADDQQHLLPLAHYLHPHRGWSRLWRILVHWPRVLLTRPKAGVLAWNVCRYGDLSAGLRLQAAAVELARLPPFDAVLACFGPVGEQAIALREMGLLQGPVITSFHGRDAYRKSAERLRRKYSLLLKKADHIVPLSQHMAGRLADIGFAAERMTVIGTPINLADFTYRDPPPAGKPASVLTIGRLVEKKGVAYGLQAVSTAITFGQALHYHVIGDGHLREDLQVQAAELGITEHVTFHGWLRHGQVRELLHSADVVLMPNVTGGDGDQEGIPNAIKEAFATGVPVVATDHSANGELVEQDCSGWLVPEKDFMGMASGIKLAVSDHERAVRWTRAARDRIQAYDVTVLNDRLASLLETIAGKDT